MTNTNKVFVVLVIFCCIALKLSSTFHIEKSTKIPTTSYDKIFAVNDDVVAIQINSTIQFFTGSNFNKQYAAKFTWKNYESFKLTKKHIYVNDGTVLTKDIFQSYTISQTFAFDSDMIMTSKYVLFTSRSSPSKFIKINLSTLQIETISYPQIDQWWLTQSYNLISDVGNGDIAIGVRNRVLIVDNETLKKKQVIEAVTYAQDYYMQQLSSFYDPSTKESIILFRNYGLNCLTEIWKSNHPSEPYKYYSAFCMDDKAGFKTYLTNTNTAISFLYQQDSRLNRKVIYWQNFNFILSRTMNASDPMGGQIPKAVTSNQSIIMRSGDVFDIMDNYEFTLRTNLNITLQNQQIQITNDDHYLFSFVAQSTIIRLDLLSKQKIIVTDSDGSQIKVEHLHLFDMQFDRLLLTCVKNERYYMQLRTIRTLQLIDQLLIEDYQIPVVDYQKKRPILQLHCPQKMIEEGFICLLSQQLLKEATNKIQKFTIQSDKIIIVSNSTINQNRQKYQTCLNYLIRYCIKPKYQQRYVSIIDYATFQEVGRPFYGSASISVQQNILIINQKVYDLSKSTNPLGFLLLDPKVYSFSAILPKKGLYVQINLYKERLPTKVIYNITVPSAKQKNQLKNSSQSDWPIYFTQKVNGSQCNVIYFVTYKKKDYRNFQNAFLIRQAQCEAQIGNFSINTPQYLNRIQLSISADKQYLIIVICCYSSIQLEIRPINNQGIIVYRNFLELTQQQCRYNIKVVMGMDKRIFIHAGLRIIILEMGSSRQANIYGLNSISAFDISDNNITILAGPTQKNQSQIVFVVIDQTSKNTTIQHITSKKVNKVTISPQGSNFIVLTDDSQIILWDIALNKVKFSIVEPTLIKVQFANEDLILLQFPSNFCLINVTSPNNCSGINKNLAPKQKYDVQVGLNGTIIAELIGNIMNLYSSITGEFLTNFTGSNSQLSASFSPNYLFVSDQSNLYAIESSPCSDTYNNQNLFCNCPQGLFSKDNVCQECSLICKSCTITAFSCTEYGIGFFVILIGGGILLLGGIIGIIFCKRKRNADKEIKESLIQESERSNENQQSIMKDT